MDQPFLREHNKPKAIQPKTDLKTWFGLAAVGSIVVMIGLIIYRVAVPSDATLQSRKVSAALLNCQQKIASLAQFGEAEMPPYAKNHGSAGEFYFAWGSGSFHFKNLYGTPVKMSASCVGDLETGAIQQLTINGQKIL